MKQITPVVLLLLVGAFAGCRAKGHSPFQNASPPQRAASTAIKVPKVYPEAVAVPIGPPLGVLPGRGLGPLRFGASLATVERLLGVPCTQRSTSPGPQGDLEHCLFALHGLEVELQAGSVVRLRVHGSERKFPGNTTTPRGNWGSFNGRFKGAALGMYAEAVVEQLGEPSQVQNVNPPQGATVLRQIYPHNTVLEYDKIENGNVVLAGIVLEPDMQEIERSRQAAMAAAANANAPSAAEPAPSQAQEADSKSSKAKKRAKARAHHAKH